MKFDRLIKILLHLQNGETITAKSLADEMEVSIRTIHRDMESLSHAGIPIYSERGKSGGWRLVDDWKYKLSWLKQEEIISLFLPTSQKLLSDLEINISTDELKHKLLQTVPNSFRQNASDLSERIHIDLDTWRNDGKTIKSMKPIQQAVMNDQKLYISYKKADGECKDYTINPLGLVAKGNAWYIAAINGNDEYRNFKVSRICAFSLLDKKSKRPVNFVLADYWEESKKQFVKNLPEYIVDVELSNKIVDRITFTGRFVRSINNYQRDQSPKWIQATLSFPTEQEAIEFILGFGNRIRVITPKHLGKKLVEEAGKVIGLYD